MPEKHPLRPQRQPVLLGMAASSAMALFGRHRLPYRSTLSRFLAALDQASLAKAHLFRVNDPGTCKSPLKHCAPGVQSQF